MAPQLQRVARKKLPAKKARESPCRLAVNGLPLPRSERADSRRGGTSKLARRWWRPAACRQAVMRASRFAIQRTEAGAAVARSIS